MADNTSKRIIILRGLPASGKSTWAKEFVENNDGYVRINRDSLRHMSGKYWIPEREGYITSIEKSAVESALDYGFNVVLDSTNFNPKVRVWVDDLARKYSYEVEERTFDTPLEECIRRDKEREKSVGEAIIRGMHKRYFKPSYIKTDERVIAKQDPNLPKCCIIDIDGTLALINGRSPFDDTKIHTDKPNGPVIDLVRNKHLQYAFDSMESDGMLGGSIIIMSGRQDKCMPETIAWLKDRDIPFDSIYMRKTNDFRKDSIIKKELYEEYIKDNYYVEFVLDDRDQVVKQWRELGLLCLQVYYGDF